MAAPLPDDEGVPTPGEGEPEIGEPDVEFTVPDDAAALEADRLRLIDERARGVGSASGPDFTLREPHPQLPRFMATRRWERFGLSGPLVITVLVVVAVLGSMMTLLRPSIDAAPQARPLAPVSTGAVGLSGSLLPDSAATLNDVPLSLQRLRPGVIVVVPPGPCPECSDVVDSAAAQARDFRLRTFVMGAPGQESDLAALDRRSPAVATLPVVDLERSLTGVYPGPGATILTVRADGIIDDVIVDALPSVRLAYTLERLAQASTSP